MIQQPGQRPHLHFFAPFSPSFISSQPVPNADFVVPIEIDGTVHNVFVLKRPYVDEFLEAIGDLFEIVLFTASLSKASASNVYHQRTENCLSSSSIFPQYADPVSDHLDKQRVFRHRLFREHCVFHRGNYVKVLRFFEKAQAAVFL